MQLMYYLYNSTAWFYEALYDIQYMTLYDSSCNQNANKKKYAKLKDDWQG